MPDNDDLAKILGEEAEKLREQIRKLKAMNIEEMFDGTPRRRRKKPEHKHGEVRIIMEKGEKKLPVVVPPPRKQPEIQWAGKPTSDTVPPHGLSQRETNAWMEAHPGEPLPEYLEGATKPMRKQMVRLNKVWKYRNFKGCLNCGAFDTWESRTDPYSSEYGVRPTHAEIWCHTCGSIETEVSLSIPAHIGVWSPKKETEKERKLRVESQAYRRERTIFSLVQQPKTPAELTKWFRDVEKYHAVDFVMIEIMLRKMQEQNLVVKDKRTGKYWEKEDWDYEQQERRKRKE